MKFKLLCASFETQETKIFYYDNETSLFTDEYNQPVFNTSPEEYSKVVRVSKDNPGKKDNLTTLKIALGLSCNYSCSYCSQRFVPNATETIHEQYKKFLKNLPLWFDVTNKGKGVKIEFWGGEPLVYIKTLQPLANELKKLLPEARYVMITNGSLLTLEINEWIENFGFNIGISHDGPGQFLRGPDPFDHKSQYLIIRDLYRRLRPHNRISFNTMLNAKNYDREEIVKFFQERFGEDVPIGEGGFIDAYDNNGAALSINPSDAKEIRTKLFYDIRHGKNSNMQIVRSKINEFIESVRTVRPATALGQKCGMDREQVIAVDLKGNILTCQNVSSVATAPNGKSHLIGHVSNLQNAKLNTATHWSFREECSKCPVLQLCKGSCMFLENELFQKSCDNSFNDNISFFAAAIEMMTGYIPIRIEGPQREDRKNIWD